MSCFEAKAIRLEIDDLLTSGRIERIETVSAHIFQMVDRQWKELTNTEVLVHIVRDSVDDVYKILARDQFKLIFNFAPLSACFTFSCLSSKFVRLIINKFDRATSAYGFGFSSSREMEKFCDQLDRTSIYAKATLAPSLHSASVGLNKLDIRSASSTPNRTNIPHDVTESSRNGYNSFVGNPLVYNCLSTTSCNYPPSPYRQPLVTYNNYLPLSTSVQNKEFLSSSSVERFDVSQNNSICHEFSFRSQTTSIPMCEAPDLSKLPFPNFFGSQRPREASPESSFIIGPSSSCLTTDVSAQPSQIELFEDDVKPEDKVVAAERRLHALLDAIQPNSVMKEIWSSPVTQVTNECTANSSPKAVDRPENPAGVIGSPVKGKGGSSSRHQTPKKSCR